MFQGFFEQRNLQFGQEYQFDKMSGLRIFFFQQKVPESVNDIIEPRYLSILLYLGIGGLFADTNFLQKNPCLNNLFL